MNSVVSTRNKHLVQRDEAVIGYLLAGYPEPTEFLHLLREVEATGLDALEIGYPSENPFADGEIIQAAHRAESPWPETSLTGGRLGSLLRCPSG